jgi:hypothetical protein
MEKKGSKAMQGQERKGKDRAGKEMKGRKG